MEVCSIHNICCNHNVERCTVELRHMLVIEGKLLHNNLCVGKSLLVHCNGCLKCPHYLWISICDLDISGIAADGKREAGQTESSAKNQHAAACEEVGMLRDVAG